MLEVEAGKDKIAKYEKAEPLLLQAGFVKLGTWGFRKTVSKGYPSYIDYYPTTARLWGGGKKHHLSVENVLGIVKAIDAGYSYEEARRIWFKGIGKYL